MAYDFRNDLFDILGKALDDPSKYTGNKCPLCGSSMQEMPNGKELCSNYPNCSNSLYK